MPAVPLRSSGGKSGWWVLHLSLNGARFESADDIAGLGVYGAASRLLSWRGSSSHRVTGGNAILPYLTVEPFALGRFTKRPSGEAATP